MATGIQVVERIEDDYETLEPVDIELRVFDVGVMRLDCDIGVELAGGFSRDLIYVLVNNNQSGNESRDADEPGPLTF